MILRTAQPGGGPGDRQPHETTPRFRGRVLPLDRGAAVVLLMGILAAWAFVAYALQRKASLAPFAYDEAFYNQIIWNTAHGRWFASSFLPYPAIGEHFQPVLALYAVATRLGAGSTFPVLLQALVVCAAAVPLYGAVRRITGSAGLATVAAAAWLASPFLHRQLEFDFHPEVISAPFIFGSVWAMAAGRARLAAVLALPLLLLKEDEALTLLSLAGFAWLRFGQRRTAATLAGAALLWLGAVALTMPLIRDGHGNQLYDRFAYIDRDWTAVIEVARHLAYGPTLGACLLLALSLGFLPLLDWRAALVASPVLVGNLLSAHEAQRTLEIHYSAEALPLMMVVALLASRSLRDRQRAAGTLLAGGTIIAFAISSPLVPWREHWSPPPQHVAAVQEALAMVPAGASLSASTHVAPLSAHRERLYEFPAGTFPDDPAQWAVVDTGMGTTEQVLEAGFRRRLAEMETEGYRRVYAKEGIFVLQRTTGEIASLH